MKPIIIERYSKLLDGWEFLQDYNDNEEELAIQVMEKGKELKPDNKLRVVKVLSITE